MIIPFTKQASATQQAPQIPPVYVAMAAAQMHAEGRWPSDNELQAKRVSTEQPAKDSE